MTSTQQYVLFLEGEPRAVLVSGSVPFTVRGQSWSRVQDFDSGCTFYDYLVTGEQLLAGLRFWLTGSLTSEQRSFWKTLCMNGRGVDNIKQGFVDLWLRPDDRVENISVEVVQDFGGEIPLQSGRRCGLGVKVPKR